ncbi:acyl-CoA/acyl-ACP dehydrogenase [Candidatus Binatia bacterium]|jgi:alkylation response protein AidB-like acyl-CoA dehydrogenase|nr:acyl-CoA/acyl-ACP dehydrogenase [Candidatus Binatia bacterium]
MLLQPTSDQELLRETTARFLDETVPPAELRRLRDDPVGFADAWWKRGAELGWTSLLVSEENGGGSISDRGLVDLSLLTYEFGRRAAPGPLVPASIVAAALSGTGGNAHAPVLARLLSGDAIATWCLAEPRPNDRLGAIALEIRSDGGDVLLSGVKRPVEAAASASHLLVTGRTGDGLTQVLVPADAPGVTIAPMESVDLTRRFHRVTFESVRVPASALVGEPGRADMQVERQLQQALVLLAAESVGAMQSGFDMTLAWAFDRFSFGRPLASYQAIKHRFADLKAWLEASHAIADAAVAAVDAGSEEAAELASIAKAYVGDQGAELLQDCVQLHGGIGVTFEHDLHFFLRRLTVDRALYGTPAEHRQRLTALLERRAEAA